ncbi:NAD(P)-dependent oxidoreductase [Mangrovibacterium diazotrophicum]|uniref:3-hydroxyisobutyrate dehydrogenase-like beta-hydroxyacid dehydrogenase n=1 Tax=Mangrovibacterium diazotrophicum TaxID=1261403 RepID=A0A419W5Y1_9BACT|nr:NAD(P)-dependent oxidoreductase [Mangrovibacterium diazotrophicum]RKD90855.1 3-hydroxyisobutyrate dehydrogenase-like beta-hydroxyacid dehydrogenase [Mangrovibacterium diazotrophicum]
MKLSLLLLGLSIKMKMANKNNDLFRQRLKTRTGSILIRTADRSVGRLFTFSKGHIFTKAERFGDADVQMVWKDVNVAFKTMTSSDPQALFRAMDNGDVNMVGDLSVAQWFSLLIKALKAGETKARDEKSPRVAMIGLGKMGKGIAANIQAAGFELVVYNRTSNKAIPFVEKGAILAKTPSEAASLANIVVTSLMDDESVRNIVNAKDGILAGLAKGGIHLCATTISPELSRELEEIHRKHGSHFVMGAVVGRPDAAESGELLTLMAGEKECIDQCREVSSAYSAATLVIGNDPWLANYAKLSVNYFAVSNMELMGQLYAMGDATGIGRAFYKQIFESSYSNPILKFYAQKIMDREYQENVGFELSGGLKDVKLMLKASNATSCSLDYAPIIISKMEQAIESGNEHCDWSVFTNI